VSSYTIKVYHSLIFTSDSIEESNNEGSIAAIIGTGALSSYFKVTGTIGIIGFYHLKGNNKVVKA